MPPKSIISSVAFQDPQGNVLANGSIVFDLTVPAEIPGGGQVVPTRVDVLLTSGGLIPGSAVIWGNDQLNPGGTLYQVRIFNSNGLLVEGPVFWSITGTAPIDLSGMIPVSTSTLLFSLPGPNSQIFTSGGTFTIPATVNKIKVTVVASGGAGGGGTAGPLVGAGGGAGGASIKWLTGLTPGLTLTVSVASAATGVSGSSGNNGTSSSVSSGTQVITTITTNGGTGGNTNAVLTNTTNGGTAGTGGDLNFGGCGGSFGLVSGGSNSGGDGGASIYGGAGVGGGSSAGGNATAFGAGGGGSGSGGPTAGGTSGAGVVIFEWIA